MAMEDDPDLGTYVAGSYMHLLTDLEIRACRAMTMEQKAIWADDSSPGMARMLRKLSPGNDPDVRDALKEGPSEFWRRVTERLLREHPAEFRLARCRRCGRLLRTPKARQCLACGLDWH
jgi:hypothetical protein